MYETMEYQCGKNKMVNTRIICLVVDVYSVWICNMLIFCFKVQATFFSRLGDFFNLKRKGGDCGGRRRERRSGK